MGFSVQIPIWGCWLIACLVLWVITSLCIGSGEKSRGGMYDFPDFMNIGGHMLNTIAWLVAALVGVIVCLIIGAK